ncbi:hypothetical protein Plo01_73310 [Planobispora longispora]|uniref:Uncharacterized protein n=1 Tax=Planobispora longispora TaxID=28887 RepID=A0A8J3RSB9_9ACTN|nr:hypothetical protein GCM10020093_007620 [Planobispora longispora]GIH80902.1 hypothetical protein Plo01_73310 [Planobispora longispora]
MPRPGASSLSYRAAIPLSNRTLVRLAELIRAHRATALPPAPPWPTTCTPPYAGPPARPAYAAGVGTPLPIDRLADEAPYHSGKHHRRGMNVQFLEMISIR